MEAAVARGPGGVRTGRDALPAYRRQPLAGGMPGPAAGDGLDHDGPIPLNTGPFVRRTFRLICQARTAASRRMPSVISAGVWVVKDNRRVAGSGAPA